MLHPFKSLSEKIVGRLSLRTVLTVPFIVLIVGTVGTVGYLAFKNDREAVTDYVEQLMTKTSKRVNTHLDNYLVTPHRINEIDVQAIEMGLLNVKDFEKTGRYFWKQVQVFEVSYIGYTLTTGESVGAGRWQESQSILIDESSPRTKGKFHSYETDRQGNRTKLVHSVDYDGTTDTWYAQAVKAGKPIWSDVYSAEGFAEHLAIAASYPFYDRNGQLQGVIGIDLLLSDLSNFLRQLEISPSAQVLIVERDGKLIASSSSENPFAVINGKTQRINAIATQASIGHLSEKFGSLEKIDVAQQIIFNNKGQQEFIQVSPYRDRFGLDWLIVIVVPETDFTDDIEADTFINVTMSAIALIMATTLGIFIARWVSKPIVRLNAAAKEIAAGNLEQSVEINRHDELGELAKSFNLMAVQLQTSFKELRSLNTVLSEREKQLAIANQTLEQTVQQRTEQLQAAQEEIVQAEKMAALGQLVAGIAHEINPPLGAIRASIGNITNNLSQSLQQLPQLFRQLSPEQLKDFFALLDMTRQPRELLSFREERQLKRRLKQSLETQGIEQADLVADLLSRMGILPEELNPILPLLQASDRVFILETAYHLSAIQNNSQNIELAVERAAKIVFALKNYVRQDSSQTMVEASVIDGIETVLTIYHNQIKSGIEVSKSYSTVPLILCHPDELTQVWSNLISNAIQAMNYQGRLEIAVFEQENHLVVEIVDFGCGIPAEIQQKIFEPFFTTKPIGEGSGLGLNIVHKIVDRHHGKVEVISQPGHTKFRVKLPI
jgi:signal transduction histidine kinase